MLIVMLGFTIVFLFRDVQVLTIRDHRALLARFAGYTLLLVVAVALVAGSVDASPGIFHAWTQRKFASPPLWSRWRNWGWALR